MSPKATPDKVTLPDFPLFPCFQQVLSEPIFGKGMRRSTPQRKKGVFSEKGGGNSVNQALVRISTGKAIQ